MEYTDFIRTITPNYCVERVPRAVGKHIVHRTTCNQKINNIDIVGQCVSDLPPLDWSRTRVRGPVVACAHCMSRDAQRRAGSWPPPNLAANYKHNNPVVGEIVFVAGSKDVAYPAFYYEGPHPISTLATGLNPKYNRNSVIRFLDGAKRITAPPHMMIEMTYGLWNHYLLHKTGQGDMVPARYLGLDGERKKLIVEHLKTGMAYLSEIDDVCIVIGKPE